MKKKYSSFLAFSLLLLLGNLNAQVSGTVFRDYNGNGTKESLEPLVAGITVNIYTAASATPCGSAVTTSAAAPNYSITGTCSGAVRVEFELPTTNPNACGPLSGVDFSAVGGSTYGTAVQFVTNPATNVNFAVTYPDDYWDNTNNPAPGFLIPNYVNGAAVNSPHATSAAVLRIDNNQSGLTPTTTKVADWAEVGAVWGMAHQKSEDRFFMSTLAKRHSGFGPQGPGGVYIAEKVSGSYDVTGSFTLDGVTPANGGGAISLGSITRVTSPATADNYLTNATEQPAGGPNRDLDAFGKVGKVSYGDADMYEEGNLLFLVNTFQRSIITVDVSGGTAALNNASAGTLGPLTNSYTISSLPGAPSCGVTGVLRPWALKIYRGVGYMGLVCDASVSQVQDDVTGFIVKFDPENIGAGFTQIIPLNLDYKPSGSWADGARWNPWSSTWAQTGLNTVDGSFVHSEPIISNLEFDENGGMTIMIMNRFGNQMAASNYLPVSGNTSLVQGQSYGDILYACYNTTTGVWTMEGAACSALNSEPNFGYSGTGFEHYEDNSGDGSLENGMGSMAKLMGNGQMVAVVVDPFPPATPSNPTYYSTGGLHWFDIATGDWVDFAQLYSGSGAFGKATGLGDIESDIPSSPLEIGNRVWNDTDEDGVQDPDESPIAGVKIQLWSDAAGDGAPDALLGTATTNANGNWFFSTDPNSTYYEDGLAPETHFVIQVDPTQYLNSGVAATPLASLSLTTSNAAAAPASPDVRDNDATSVGGIARFSITTGKYGENNHTYDIGFKAAACTPPTLVTIAGGVCAGGSINLASLVSGNTPAGTLSYYTTSADATAGTNALASSTVSPGSTTTYYVRSTIDASCFSTASITVTVVNPPVLAVTNGSTCSGANINLGTLVTNSGGGTLSYHTTSADAFNDVNAIATSIVAPTTATSYYIRSEITQSGATCYDVEAVVVTIKATTCGTINTSGPN